MCLIAVAWDCHPRFRLALIANRDELHARPTAPAMTDPLDPDLHGGRDLLAGGSWLLVSRRGRAAAVTNVRTGPTAATMSRSRGDLVRGFTASRDDTGAWLRSLEPQAGYFGPFNLLLWDGRSLTFASNHPDYVENPVTPGLHAMSNGVFDAPWPKSTHATRALSGWLRANDAPAEHADVTPLLAALADDSPAPDEALPDTGVGRELERLLSPPFVRDRRYGTRCSTVVLVGDAGIRFVERRFDADARVIGNTDTWLARKEKPQSSGTDPVG